MENIFIRPANAEDVPAINAIVQAAYTPYIERLGRLPAAMMSDYAGLVATGDVSVLIKESRVAGLIVLKVSTDHLLISNLAVSVEHQGSGLGRQLLQYADSRAEAESIDELRLYTNELMHENVAIYNKLGWAEYARAEQDGFRRVFMKKRRISLS